MAMVTGGLTATSITSLRSLNKRKCRVVAEAGETSSKQVKDYYTILCVSPLATTEQIRKSYRKLQKQHHPDISGVKGHEMTLLLNEAYHTLTDHHLRAKYDAAFPHLASSTAKRFYQQHPHSTNPSQSYVYSGWRGPDRPEGLFVDENACIGCRECWFAAKNTFTFDESTGSARVITQFGDSDELIKTAIHTCPVNCIHWVDRGDLRTLEYLMRPRQRPSNGVYGGGWERPSNVFMAAKVFKKVAENIRSPQSSSSSSSAAQAASSSTSETPAQKKARAQADMKLRMGPLWSLFSWITDHTGTGSKASSRDTSHSPPRARPSQLGKSCTSEIYSHELPIEARAKTIQAVQEWAINFASSSEIPLPMPFQADMLLNGVELKLISPGDGVLSSIGSFHITVDLATTSPDSLQETCLLCITRHGASDTGSLPGEGRIVKLVRDMLLRKDSSYANYHIPWKSI